MSALVVRPSDVNKLSREMRAAIGDLMAHDRLTFMGGHYETAAGACHRAATIGSLVRRGIVALTSPQPRHIVAKLSAPGRKVVCIAAGAEADHLMAGSTAP